MTIELERKMDEQQRRMTAEHDEKARDLRQSLRVTVLLAAFLTPLIVFVVVYLTRLAWDLAGGAL